MAGAVYGLMCVGLGLIFGVMRVINFAQGEFLMLGMYAALYLAGMGGVALLGPAIGPFVAALLAAPVLYAAGVLIHRFLLSRVTATGRSGAHEEAQHSQLILTLGIALVLQNGGLLLFGSEPRGIRTPLSSDAWEMGAAGIGVFVNQARLVSAVIAAAAAALLFTVINRSRMGKSLKAASDNAEAATYMGIDVMRSHRVAFALGVAATGVAGGLVATYATFQPYVGLEYVIIMYTGVVLGGMGSVPGAFWGGMLIGLVQQLSVLVLPAQLQNAAIFVVFLAVMLLKPQGLFGRNVERT
jgi:branched-chain amino acid transport system permease protein